MMCVCSLSYPSYNAHASYGQSIACTAVRYSPHYLINGTFFGGKKNMEQKLCFNFLYNLCLKHLSFINSVFCLTTGPMSPQKRCLHIVRSRASSFKWEYPLLSLRSSNSFLRLLPRLLVTSISPFIFPSITCFRRQFLCE